MNSISLLADEGVALAREEDEGVGPAREEIDELDGRLVELLAERCRLALTLGRTKASTGRPVQDPTREAAVVRLAARRARESGLDEELVRRIYWSVIELSRRTQENGRQVEAQL